MIPRSTVRELFDTAVEAVKPDRLIDRAVSVEGDRVRFGETWFDLRPGARLFVVGAGKASGLMARALEGVLGERIVGGLVVVKYGHAAPCQRIQIVEAAHPYPDAAGFKAAEEIVRICGEARQGDIVICLLSGGGSALLADRPAGVSLQDWTDFSKALVNSGASIGEINSVRKHLSGIKGGQLARITWPGHLVCLSLSDVVGDPLDVIASGPGVADPTTFADALEVIRRYSMASTTPAEVIDHLTKGCRGDLPETPKAGDVSLSRATNVLIGSNRMALEAALGRAAEMGLEGEIVTAELQGDCTVAAEYIVKVARERSGRGSEPRCLLFGGETTLRVTGGGKGGRSQHLALTCAKLLRPGEGITVLAAGTDGNDGPTDAAGAIVDGQTWAETSRAGAGPQGFLDGFDSYNFFARSGGHVITGPTMTNVMDVIVVMLNVTFVVPHSGAH